MGARERIVQYKEKNEVGVWRKWREGEGARQEVSSFLSCDSYWGGLCRGNIRYLENTGYNVLSVVPGALLG